MSDELWKFLVTVVASSAGTTALLGIAAVLGRSQISHWLNKDLEAVKAAHQIQLEAYKVSLIAQVESVKAQVDVKKVLAVKVAEKRFAAVERLHSAILATGYSRIAAAVGILANDDSPKEWFSTRKTELIDGIYEISQSANAAAQFLESQELSTLHNYTAIASAISAEINADNPKAAWNRLKSEEVEFQRLAFESQRIVHKRLEAMIDM